MISQKNLKHLLLGVCLSATAVSAMEVAPLNDQGRADGWGDGENVMNRQRRQMCRESAEQLFAVIEPHIPTATAMQQIRAWLNAYRNNPQEYNNPRMVRQVNCRDYSTGRHVATRNYIDDAIKGFNAIQNNGYFFSEQINNAQVRMDEVLTLIWNAIEQYPMISGSPNAANDQINMRLTLLKKGLAEIVEDDNHTVCGVGQSQRILLCLQGSIDGINIDGVYRLNGNGGEVQIDVHGFSTRCNEVLTEYLAGLPEDHPLSRLVGMELYPNVNAGRVRNILDNIRNNWRQAATIVFARNLQDQRLAQAAIDRRFQQYYDLLDGSNINEDLGNFVGDAAAGINEAFYQDGAPQQQQQQPRIVQQQQPAVQFQQQLPRVVQQPQVVQQRQPIWQRVQAIPQQQPRVVQQPQVLQQPQYTRGQIVMHNGIRHRWNGSKLVRL